MTIKLESGRRILDWPEDERPREKFLQRGADALSDAELLAIFLRVGVRGKTALDLARDLLQEFGDLRHLLNADKDRFCQTKGIGEAKYVQLHAAKALMQRYLANGLQRDDVMDSVAASKAFLSARLRDQVIEVFAILFLDNRNRVICYKQLFTGSISSATVHPREIIRHCLDYNAASVILAHNHPSGIAEPSQADINLTQHLKTTLKVIDVIVHDHVSIGDQCVSLAERGLC